jgi:hypothetical protein
MSLRSACDPHGATCDPPATRLRSSYLSAFYHPAIHCDPPVFNPPIPLCALARAFHPVLRPAALTLRSVETLPIEHHHDR